MKNSNKENVLIKQKGTRKYKSYRFCSNAEKDKRQRQKAWMLHRRDAIVIYPIRFTFYEVPKSRPFHGFLFFQLLTGTTVKSLGTLLHFWGAFQFTQVQPLSSPHKQCWTRVSSIFFQFQLCIGWGEGEL